MLSWYGRYSMSDVLDMTFKDRQWHIDRLIRQAKTEAAAMKRSARGK